MVKIDQAKVLVITDEYTNASTLWYRLVKFINDINGNFIENAEYPSLRVKLTNGDEWVFNQAETGYAYDSWANKYIDEVDFSIILNESLDYVDFRTKVINW